MERTPICPNCRIILHPKEENNTVVMECKICGFKGEYKGWVEHMCSKCGCDKAIVLFHAMTKGDEDATGLFKCIRCGHNSREGFMS